MNQYNWDDSITVGNGGEAILDAYFGKDYIVVKATRHHQVHQKIDRFLIKRLDGLIIHRVDYKIDTKCWWSNNLVMEYTSVYRNGCCEAKGWIHTTIANLLIVYSEKLDRAFIMELVNLRLHFDVMKKIFPHDKTSTLQDNGSTYETHFVKVPIHWLRRTGLFLDEFTIGQQQLEF